MYEKITEAVDFLKQFISETPEVAMILGSGLGALGDELEDAKKISYSEIPHFPTSAVEGHAGNLVFGKLAGKNVVVMQGRVHAYEGWSAEEVTFPVRVFSLLGIEKLLVTNSAGGINRDFKPGDLMLITDHLNLTGQNPLEGENDDRFGVRFPDMSEAYCLEAREAIINAARELNIPLKAGVYAGVLGPSYETPAEVRMIGFGGGDAVGMSTVPEVIIANHCGIKVGGISCISNLAAGISAQKLTHDEVKETAQLVRETFIHLVTKTVQLW